MTSEERALYKAGRQARENEEAKSAPGHLDLRERSWFLAGWHDRDIELTRSKVA